MGMFINKQRSTRQRAQSLKIVAKTLFKELKDNGYDCRHIVDLSTELLELVTSELGQNTNNA